jgi:hypothetical protein
MSNVEQNKTIYYMTDYIVAIPTYNRSETLVQKTLTTLKKGGVRPSKVFIFLANNEEKDNYEKVVPKELYHKMVVGKKGISEQRRFISKFFKEGQRIVSIDDDVEGVFKLKNAKTLMRITNLDKFYKDSFQRLSDENLFIWGIYPVNNAFFMKDNISTSLKFIIGTMYGFVNRHSPDLIISDEIEEKEDFELSILYFLKDGGVIRYNNVTIKTKFHSDGGLGKTPGRLAANKRSAHFLKKKYPDLISIFVRDNGMTEVRLKKVERGQPMTKSMKNSKSKANKTKKNRK